jgi:hypothetical protein
LPVLAVDEASSQTAAPSKLETPAEIAQAIVRAIETKVPKIPNVPLAFESATSHDNVVELRYIANDTRVFPHNDSEREERRLRFAYRFCFSNGSLSLIKRNGVVIHQFLKAPDNSAPFEFIVDEPTCATLAADIKARAAAMKRPESLDEPKHISIVPIRPGQAKQ